MRWLKIFSCLLIQLSSGMIGSLWSQTVLPETIASDYTLTITDSPYLAEDDVTVLDGARLTVDPGVTIYFASNAGLYVYGSVQMNGTESQLIQLLAESGENEWEAVSIIESHDYSVFSYVQIRGCSKGDEPDRDRAAINATDVGEVSLYHVDIRNVSACIFFIDTSEKCTFQDCYFSCNDRGSVFNLVRAEALIKDCEFAGVYGTNSDAIDFDKVVAEITGNLVYGMTAPDCDGIDMGSASEVYLADNIIKDCSDSGIEAEEETVITAERNLILNCNIGFTVKELATASLLNNTLFNNDLGFSAYSESGTYGRGGEVNAINNIIFGSDDLYRRADGSDFSFRYNLSFPGNLSGTGNFSADPLFNDPDNEDFHLSPDSPAIDAGDPNLGNDPDGTLKDLGAFWFEQVKKSDIIFSEVHYHPLNGQLENSEDEFIELYNHDDKPIDLSGYYLSGALSCTFPEGTWLDTRDFLIVVKNKERYAEVVSQTFEWASGNLGNSGSIMLKDKQNQLIADLNYQSVAPWPKLTGTSNLSIELADYDLNTRNGENWRYSYEDGGTPGRENIRYRYHGILINELVSKFGILVEDEFGNHSDWIEIYNSYDVPVYLGGLALYDSETDCEDCTFSHDLPDELRIAPKSFLLLYADARPDRGSLHMPFQLQSSGESLTLARFDGLSCSPFDQVDFGPLDVDQAYGRYPDGSTEWMIMSIPTPGFSNRTMQLADYEGLFINEMVARYDETYPDEHGLYSDWIELYNSTNQEMNLSGLFLSDNPEDPIKYQIPVSTSDSAIIMPHNYMIIRADALPNLGFNHADFQLSSSGESVLLSLFSGGAVQVIDRIDYPRMLLGQSYGRLGDGARWWSWFGIPTPDAPNGTTSVETTELSMSDWVHVYPNPAADWLTITVDRADHGAMKVRLMNNLGKIIISQNYPVGASTINLKLSQLDRGSYHLLVYQSEKLYRETLLIITPGF